jgi:hypothetical protein
MIDPISAIVATTAVVNEVSVLLTAITTVLAKLGTAAASIIAACAVIARFMPPPEPGSRLAKFYNLINTLAQNKGYAENK